MTWYGGSRDTDLEMLAGVYSAVDESLFRSSYWRSDQLPW